MNRPDPTRESLRLALLEAHSIINAEIQSRTQIKPMPAPLFAADFDIIYKFAHFDKEVENEDLGAAAADMLASSDDVQVTLPPGATWELFKHCAALAGSSQRLVALAAKSASVQEDFRLDLDPTTREELVRDLNGMAERTTAIKRLTLFLQSANLRSLQECGLPFSTSTMDESIYNVLFESMSQLRRLTRAAQSHCDALNVVAVLAAQSTGVFLPLVTNTHTVHQACHALTSDVRFAPLKTNRILLSPRQAIGQIGFRSASDEQLRQLRFKVASLQQTFEQLPGWPDAEHTEDLPFKVIVEAKDLIQQLYSTSSQLSAAWTPPTISLTSHSAPRHFANVLGNRAKELDTSLAELFATFQRRFGSGEAVAWGKDQWALTRAHVDPELELLCKPVDSPRMFIEKIIEVREGGSITVNQVNQTGSDLVTAMDGSSANIDRSGDVARYLKNLVAAVSSASIDNATKKEILESINDVAVSATKDKKLKGMSKMAWSAIREGIATVPSAVAAWEALRKIWS